MNNAAITYFEPVSTFSESHYRLMFDVQVRTPFVLAQAYVPPIRDRHRGWILNISSGAAVHPTGPPFITLPGGTVYGMCKAALERFTTGLAAEVWNDGIAVNALSPSGLVVTPGVVHHKLDQYVPREAPRTRQLHGRSRVRPVHCRPDGRDRQGHVREADPRRAGRAAARVSCSVRANAL